MMHEAEILTAGNMIIPTILSAEAARVIQDDDPALFVAYPVSDMDTIYFEFGPGTPAYLGEFFVSLGKESRKGVLTEAGEVFFMASVRPANNIKRIVKRYPMLQSLEIHQGKIWEK